MRCRHKKVEENEGGELVCQRCNEVVFKQLFWSYTIEHDFGTKEQFETTLGVLEGLKDRVSKQLSNPKDNNSVIV